MKSNKKSNVIVYMITLLVFGLIALMYITFAYFSFAVGNDFIIIPLYNATSTTNYGDNIETAFATTVEDYQGTNLDFIDDFWFFSYCLVSVLGFYGAYSSRTTNYWSWLSMLTYGLMLMLFIAGLFYVVINWWYNDILLKLFDNLAINLPKFAWYIRNYGFLFLLQSAAMLLINIVDLDISYIRNRKKKEQASLDDEIV